MLTGLIDDFALLKTNEMKCFKLRKEPITCVFIYKLSRHLMIKLMFTENPHKDTVFISGKNNDNVEKHEIRRQKTEDVRPNPTKSTKIRQPTLDCNHLECNNTVNSICGGREIEKKWKYRLFLNECFFRKVNCGFQHATNSE